MTKFERRKGFLWPIGDRECFTAVYHATGDLDLAMSLTPKLRVAVQAGGNCGIWPARMAEKFAKVYTFEPDPVNYHCLMENIPANVVPRQAALGDEPGFVGMVCDPANVGAHYIKGDGEIEVVTIDSLRLRACDLIVLDVEGYELRALKGAAKTLARCKPVIHIEDKGLDSQYGYGSKMGDAEKWLAAEFGYRVKHRPRRDVILTV